MQSLVGSSEISGVVGWIIIKYGGIPRNIETNMINIPIMYKPTGYFKPTNSRNHFDSWTKKERCLLVYQ